jgi:hypothetical protein
MISKRIGKDLEGSDLGQIKILFQHFPKEPRKAKENLSHNSQCHDRNSNRVPPEYKSSALPLHQLSRYHARCNQTGTAELPIPTV